jgi:uncharacterized membrane protein YhfC
MNRGFLMTQQTVPTLTIVFSAISLFIAVILPIIGIIFCRLKYKMPLYPILFGAVCFPLFVYFFEASANRFLLGTFPIRSNPIVFVLFGAFMAGLFEETGRLISFTVIERISKKPKTALTGISYGFGHGGFEAVTLVGITMLNNIIIAVSANSGAIYADWDVLTGAQQNIITTTVGTIAAEPSWMFLMGGLERLIAIPAQLALSVIMFYAIFAKRKIWLYPVAILAHMILDIPSMLYQVGIVKNIVLIESITAFIAAAVIVFAVWVNDKWKNDIKQPVLKTDETDGEGSETISLTESDSADEITVTDESEPDTN